MIAMNNDAAVASTTYDQTRAAVMSNCSTKVDSYGRCPSSNEYCTNPLYTSPTMSQSGMNVPNPNYDPKTATYCKALDNVHPGVNTVDIYGCTGPLANNPQLCADLNRGVPVGSSDTNPATYYQNPPYNQYAKSIHGPNNQYKIYAFAYDDYAAQSGYQATNADQINITFLSSWLNFFLIKYIGYGLHIFAFLTLKAPFQHVLLIHVCMCQIVPLHIVGCTIHTCIDQSRLVKRDRSTF